MSVFFARMRGLPRTVWSTAFAHFGVGVMMLGIVSVTAYETETIASLKPGETVQAGGFEVKHLGYTSRTGPNFDENSARLEVRESGDLVASMEPSKRFYPARQMPTSEAAIETFGFSQLYIALGEGTPEGATTFRIWWKPLVTLIWFGPVLMVLAGALSLTDRRLRVGVPKRARSKTGEKAYVA